VDTTEESILYSATTNFTTPVNDPANTLPVFG
jgi:hypothetical protein